MIRWRTATLGLVLAGLIPAVLGGPVTTGIDTLEASGFKVLRGKRVGLLTNPTGLNHRGEPTWRVLRRAGIKLVALFGAEHGFDGRSRAGLEVRDSTHAETGLPVFSLYGPGPVRRPTARMLEGLDVLIYDIQDTGCRSYTFISTLGLAMEACAANGVEFIVLDRPNPLGGLRVEGPPLNPRFKSLVGQWPVPYVYGLTPGELARMINGERWISNRCNLVVVPMKGWSRSMTWADTGLRWIASSPNVASGDSPLYLVSTGILGEIGGLDLGVGTPAAFRIIAASWLDSVRLARQLNGSHLSGVRFEPLTGLPPPGHPLRPSVHGVRVHILDAARAPLAAVNFHALEAVQETSGRDLFQLALRSGKDWNLFDKVCGSDSTRRDLQAGRSARLIVASWKSSEEVFLRKRRPYLLYRKP